MVRLPIISPSVVERAMKCPTSQALPHADSTSQASARGSIIHQYIADALTFGKTVALEKIPDEYHEYCNKIDLDELAVFFNG